MKLKLLVLFMLYSFFGFAQNVYLFVGTYTGSGSKGIYVYSFNTITGKATWLSNTDSLVNPSFLALSANEKYLYSVSESGGNFPGKINAFSFNKKNGQLIFINAQTSGGDNPCYVSVTSNGKWVAVGNYTGGNLSLFSTNKNGYLNPATQIIQHQGNSLNKLRQEKAHVHAVVFSPNEKYLVVPDLGMDKVMMYAFNPTSKLPISAASIPFFQSISGSGPRHFVFHPTKSYAYLIEELAGSVTAFEYKKGKLHAIQNMATHIADFKGQPGSADIHITPDGLFLYASNRGEENNIAIYKINDQNGQLKLVGYQPTLGVKPRNFCIDPSGNFLLVANQESGNVVVFKRDKISGLLTETGDQLKIPKPVCLKMSAL